MPLDDGKNTDNKSLSGGSDSVNLMSEVSSHIPPFLRVAGTYIEIFVRLREWRTATLLSIVKVGSDFIIHVGFDGVEKAHIFTLQQLDTLYKSGHCRLAARTNSQLSTYSIPYGETRFIYTVNQANGYVSLAIPSGFHPNFVVKPQAVECHGSSAASATASQIVPPSSIRAKRSARSATTSAASNAGSSKKMARPCKIEDSDADRKVRELKSAIQSAFTGLSGMLWVRSNSFEDLLKLIRTGKQSTKLNQTIEKINHCAKRVEEGAKKLSSLIQDAKNHGIPLGEILSRISDKRMATLLQLMRMAETNSHELVCSVPTHHFALIQETIQVRWSFENYMIAHPSVPLLANTVQEQAQEQSASVLIQAIPRQAGQPNPQLGDISVARAETDLQEQEDEITKLFTENACAQAPSNGFEYDSDSGYLFFRDLFPRSESTAGDDLDFASELGDSEDLLPTLTPTPTPLPR